SQRGRGPMGTPSRLRVGYHPLQVDGNCDSICNRVRGRKWNCIPLRLANRKGTPLTICDSEMH
ncbi:hypothetical protein NDU88_005492, partial [Pleurodeles waltl]